MTAKMKIKSPSDVLCCLLHTSATRPPFVCHLLACCDVHIAILLVLSHGLEDGLELVAMSVAAVEEQEKHRHAQTTNVPRQ